MWPPAIPPLFSAILRATSLAAGIYVALGVSESFFEVNLKPNRPRLLLTEIAESTFCIINATTVRSLHCLTSNILSSSDGFVTTCRNHCFLRSLIFSPSVITVCSNPIKFEPLPYLTGSTCV